MISRRRFVSGLAVAATSSVVGVRPQPASAEPPPETTKLRLLENPIICVVPQYAALDLLRSEGFTDVQYLPYPGGWNDAIPSDRKSVV